MKIMGLFSSILPKMTDRYCNFLTAILGQAVLGTAFFVNLKFFLQQRLKSQYWFDCNCISCQDNWPLMHEMTDEYLNFKCPACGAGVPFETSSNNVALKCVCGTPVPLLKV